MKHFCEILLLVFLAALIWAAFTMRLMNRETTEQIAQYQQQISQHQAAVDSLQLSLDESQGRVDTMYITLTRWRTRYDTIIEQIPTLPPDDQIALFDTYTGDHDHSLLTDTLPHAPCPMPLALIPMPRIEQALVLFTERDKLEGEVQILSQVIIEQGDQISTLHAIIEQKNGHIQVRDAWIETISEDNEVLRKRLTITQWTAGFIIFLLTVVAISQ